MLEADFKSERHIGDFAEGDVYHHGAVQITRMRNRQYVKKFGGSALCANAHKAKALGYTDPDADAKRKSLGIEDPALVSQGFLFNIGFGLSVHDISFNAVANLSYSNLAFGAPVFEGDTVSAKSRVLGVEFRKDGATSGSIQVETEVSNHRGETVLSYTRQVLVRAAKGVTHGKSSTVKPRPAKAEISTAPLPCEIAQGTLSRKLLGEGGKTFESLKEGDVLRGLPGRGLSLADFSWLQIATLNDASVHHTPSSVFIGYGGAVKAVCEGSGLASLPAAVHLGMNSGAHNAPTYPSDIVRDIYGGGEEGPHESILASAEVLEKSAISGRDDFGAVTIRLAGEKVVTRAGMKAFEKAGFSIADKIVEKNGEKTIRVLTLELVVAVATEKGFL